MLVSFSVYLVEDGSSSKLTSEMTPSQGFAAANARPTIIIATL